MIIAVPKETYPGERRVALVPASIPPLVKSGERVRMEANAGLAAGFPDDAYRAAGAEIAADRRELLESGDVSFSLTGPNLSIIVPPTTGTVFDNIPPPMPNVIDEVHLVGTGDYLLDVFAEYGGRGAWTDVYYDVRITTTPIPEPDSLALLLFALVPFWFGRGYVFAHFGK